MPGEQEGQAVKISARLILALCVVTGAFMGALLTLRYWQNRNVQSVLLDRSDAISGFFDKVVDLLGNPVLVHSKDYSVWTETADFVKTGDPHWAEENLLASFKNFDIDAVWVCRPDTTQVYFGTRLPDTGFGALLPLKGQAETLFAKSRFAHFFFQTAAGLMEVRGATIHPSEDLDRKTEPAGYLFSGRLWSREYLNKIAGQFNGSAALLQNADALTVQPGTFLEGGTLVSYFPLAAWNGTPAAVLEIRSFSSMVDRFVSNANLAVLFAAIFCASLLAIFFVLLARWVTTPLGMISVTLIQNDPGALGNLEKSGSEFGDIARLVTEHFEQGKALRQRENLLNKLFDILPVGLWIADAQGRLVRGNPAGLKIWGAEPLTGNQEYAEFHARRMPSGQEIALDDWAVTHTVNEGVTILDEELEIDAYDGKRRTLLSYSAPLLDENGKVEAAVVVNLDITGRKLAEEEWKTSEARYRSLFESAKDGILIVDAVSGRILDANPSVVAMLARPHEELVGAEFWELGAFGDIIPSRQAFEQFREADFLLYEDTKLTAGEGAEIPVEFISNTYQVGDDRVIQCNIRDISERRHLEDQLRQVQKMDAVGRLAGGVAHDFNNLLQVILGNIDLAQCVHPPGAPAWEEIDEARRAAERAAELTQQLLAFSRRQTIRLVNADLNELAGGVLSMLRRLLGETVELHFIPGDALEKVRVDRGQIEQVLVNLSVNARDAMPRGGALTIATENTVMDAAFCRKNPWAAEGRYVLVTVSDTGQGMDAATSARVFEPFYTTKEVGKGTGLGLSTVYGIVQQHKGLIHLESAPQKGTVFRLYLPVTDRPEQEALGPVKRTVGGGNETILVAEDEAPVLKLTVSLLKNAGYRVLTARDGNEAVRVFEQEKGAVDLALLDVVMPELSGREAMERMKAANSGTRFLFASGYSADAIYKDFVIDEGLHLIQKPHRREELLRAVRRILDAPDAQAPPEDPPTGAKTPGTGG